MPPGLACRFTVSELAVPSSGYRYGPHRSPLRFGRPAHSSGAWRAGVLGKSVFRSIGA
jgi:hypothetical protein